MANNFDFNGKLLINSDGNVGIKATPSSWASGYSVLNVGDAAAVSWTGAGANDFSFSTNAYYDTTDNRWEYRGTGDGSARYSMTALSYEHRWYNAPVGTANAAISYTQAMTLTGGGNLLIGTTTDSGARLRVYGGYMTVEGTNTVMYIESNYAGGNGLDAGTLISAGGTNSNIIIIPSGGGVVGSKVVGSAYNGSAWRSMLEYANVSSGEPVLSLVRTAGNVGIGTTNPGAKLEVIDEIRVTSAGSYSSVTTRQSGATGGGGFLAFQNAVANAYFGVAGWYLGNTDQGIIIGTDSSARPIRFYTNSEQMRITGGGNVLIGTTTDVGTKLNVNGVVNATDYYFNGTSSERVVKRYTAGITIAASGYTFIANVTGSSLASAIRMTMQGTSDSVVINVLADIQVNHFQDILVTTSSGFYTQVRIRIISNNNDVFSIEVEPVSAVNATSLYVEIYPLNDEVVSFSGSPQTSTTLTMTTRQGVYTVGNGGNNGTISAGGDLYVSDNAGIGTTSPTKKLHVVGAIRTESGEILANTNQGGIGWVTIEPTSAIEGQIALNVVNSSGASFASIRGNGNAYFSGSVCIGTTSPSSPFTVATDVRAASLNAADLRPQSQVNLLGGGGDSLFIGQLNNSSVYLQSSYFNTTLATYPILLNPLGGNVLIGTTTDAGYKLDVNGTFRSQGSLYTVGRQYVQVSGNTLVAYKIPYNGLSNVAGTTVSDSQASDGTAMVRYSSEGNNTFFYGPYTTLEPGNYVAKFRIKVASNASASYIGYIDVSGTNVNGTDISLRPNMFPTGGDYYYIDVPFTCNGSASGIEFRWIAWVGGITDTYLDHILVTSQAQANNVYVQDGGSYTIYEAQLPRLTILNGSGNVGIGTSSPSEKLDITDGKLRFTNTSSGRNSTIGMDDSYNLYVKNTPIGNLYIGNGTTTYVTGSFNAGGGSVQIPSGGNVIIGSTTDAGYKLDVHGEILGRDDIRILNTYALVLNGSDANWRIGRNTITDSGWLTSNTLQVVVFGGSSGQGFQVVNSNGTALFEIDGVSGASRFTNALGVGVNPSGTAGRIDASNDIVAYSSSDLRLKENIKPIENALDKVKALTGVEFDWKAEHKEAHGYEGHDTGIIAQEVQEVMPTAVRVNDTGYLAVRYEKLIGLLVEANKELAARVEELENKLK